MLFSLIIASFEILIIVFTLSNACSQIFRPTSLPMFKLFYHDQHLFVLSSKFQYRLLWFKKKWDKRFKFLEKQNNVSSQGTEDFVFPSGLSFHPYITSFSGLMPFQCVIH